MFILGIRNLRSIIYRIYLPGIFYQFLNRYVLCYELNNHWLDLIMSKIIKLFGNLAKSTLLAIAILSLLFNAFSIHVSASSTARVEEVDDDTAASVATRMPFKLGFEFQEISGLCEWALSDSRLQKKPIFSVKDKTGQKLWHLEIDTNDIEFVTEPFSHEQRDLLQQSVATIQLSLAKLVEMFNQKEGEASFEQWLEAIKLTLRDCDIMVDDEIMSKVALKTIKRPATADWVPRFSPQATVQHPLEFTIPLYFNLFGFDNPSYTLPFSASLPGIEYLKTAMREGNSVMFDKILANYNTKPGGFLFLHALTLVRMTPIEVGTDQSNLTETLTSLTHTHQVDIKSKLNLMSRRPFSLMWRDISESCLGMKYAELFYGMMSANNSFTACRVPELLQQTNYAEQFFDPFTGQTLDLSRLASNLDPTFYADNKIPIDSLLSRGVVSTTMIRNFKPDICFVRHRHNIVNTPTNCVLGTCSLRVRDVFNKYFSIAITSVEYPEDRCFLDLSTMTVESASFSYDVLSPPFFLDLENSMGRYNQALMPQDKKKYGEAIIEIRAIKDVAPRFFKKFGLSKDATPKFGKFLTDPGQISTQSLLLFNFLSEFSDENIRDFSVGLSYTLGSDRYH